MKMAAPMDHHHRKKSCDVRPAYREGRRERAVKVYTINQESRYLLVQGVPAINVTDELLKLLSLYGTIDEYRILEDYPAEAFTKVYWIKYTSIQAARVAKRKMDDQPFYGGTLHVCYAPENESIEDTRLKLQDRRKDVARHLRKLHQGKDEASHAYNSGRDNPSVSTTHDDDPLAVKSVSQTPTIPDQTKSHLIGPRRPDTTIPRPPNVNIAAIPHEEIPLQLPAPPKPLPAWEWEKPKTSHDQYPRLPTAHATLPLNFNPYPDDYVPPRVNAPQEGGIYGDAAFTVHTLPTNPTANKVTDLVTCDYVKAGARPKFKLRQDRRHGDDTSQNNPTFLERVAWRDGKGELGRNETGTRHDNSDDRRANPTSLKRSYHNQYKATQTSSVPDHRVSPHTQTPTLKLPLQLLGKRTHPAESPQLEPSGMGSIGDMGGGQSDRWMEGGNVRLPGTELTPTMGDSSFDRMVHNITQHVRTPLVPPRPAAVAAAAAAVAAAAAIAAAADGEPDSKRRRI